jgi:hypothetical protein
VNPFTIWTVVLVLLTAAAVFLLGLEVGRRPAAQPPSRPGPAPAPRPPLISFSCQSNAHYACVRCGCWCHDAIGRPVRVPGYAVRINQSPVRHHQ